MLQRIQSVYLLIATILLSIAMFLAIGLFANAGVEPVIFTPLGLIVPEAGTYSTAVLLILLILTAFLSFISIFFYKKRKLQVRISTINILLIIGFYVVEILYILKFQSVLESSFYLNWAICLPVIALIFIYLAIKGIKKDEALIKAVDRIR